MRNLHQKKVIDKEMKMAMLFGNIKGRIFAIFESSYVDQSQVNTR